MSINWIVIFLTLLVHLKNADGVARSEGKLKLGPLPMGKSYSLSKEEDKLKWNLRGLSDIADGIALALREDPPYDIIGNLLSQSFGTGGKSPSISEVIDYEVPLIVLAAFSLLAAIIVIPIVGLIFCCCRCKGNCGGSVDESDLKLHPTKERIGYSVGILFCALFLGLAGSFILSSSVKMSDSLPHARTVWEDSFGDIETYTNNTLKELNHLVAQEAVPMIRVFLVDIFAMGRAIVVPVLAKGQPVFEDLFHAVLDCQKAISQSLLLLNEIQYTVTFLVSKGNSIQFELHTARDNLTTAKDDCLRDSPGNVACDKIPEGDKLSTEANFTKVPNVNETHKKVEDVAKTNLTHEVIKGNESVHDIPQRVHNLTTNLRKDFQNYSSKIENTTADVLRPLEDSINEYINGALYPVRDDVNEKYLGPDGILTKYDKYRHVIFTLLAVLILLDAFLLLIAVILGLVGSTRYDTPSSRSNLSDWGGRLMIGAAGLFVFCAFLVNLLTGILFLAGSNIAIVCDDLPDYKLLKKTIDDPKLMGEYILAQELLGDGSVPLTASGVLSGCSKNHAPWDVLKMDHVFNLSDALDYKDKIPSINEVFEKLNDTIEDTTVLSSDATASVNDSLDAGVHEINFTQYHEQVNKPIVSVPLAPFASNVSKAADALKTVSQKASDKLKVTSDRLEHVHNTAVSGAEQQANELGRLVNQLQVQGNAIKSSFSRVMKSLEDAETFLSDDAPAIAAKAAVENWDRVFSDVDYFVDLVVKQVRFDVGRCKPLSNIYRGLTSSVCYHYAAGMNASWVALGLCALFLLISIILCVRASKHFRQVSGRERIDDSGIFDDEPLELPWLDGLGLDNSHAVDVKFVSEI